MAASNTSNEGELFKFHFNPLDRQDESRHKNGALLIPPTQIGTYESKKEIFPMSCYLKIVWKPKNYTAVRRRICDSFFTNMEDALH